MQETSGIRQQSSVGGKLPIPVELDPAHATPVYGTGELEGGIAEGMRRLAYSYPAHDTRRWMLLLAADRAESASNVSRELVVPGGQPRAVRHFVRQARAHPEGYVSAALALLGGALFVVARRRIRG